MEKSQPFDSSLFGYLHCLLPAAVTPPFLIFQFLRGILRIMDEEISILGKENLFY